MSSKNKADETLSLAERREQLEAILEELEAGEVPLEEVTARLERAASLTESIEKDLREHRASIRVLKKRFDRET